MFTNKVFACLSAVALAVVVVPMSAHGESVAEYLRSFHENPAREMERLPSLVDAQGNAHPQGYIDHDAVSATFARRQELREQIAGSLPYGLQTIAPEEKKDTVDMLVDPGTTIERNLPALQAQSLMSVATVSKPWADSYWPTYKGQIAYRYNGGGPQSKSWDENYAYYLGNPPGPLTSSGNVAAINGLSPAEKYDFVMGDPDFTLTNFAWREGQKSMEKGELATWMGICHGWSAASHMGEPFVADPVTVISQSGVPVTFYPQDIKALQSMRWANSAPASRFVGTRCTVSHPARNAYGRIVDPACFDTNPATWHLAVTNQLGRNHRGFVFDGTYDAEVWNFPIVSAHYRYFNPMTFEEKQNWNEASIPLSAYRLDKFKEFRNPAAVGIVGIYMDVTYVIEIEPGANRVFDAPTKTVRYIYDLELDAGNNVIGGEWYSNAHPDFIWTFDSGVQAMAFDENVLLSDPWANNGPVPLNWTPLARKSSARGTPLYAFLKKVTDAAGPAHQP